MDFKAFPLVLFLVLTLPVAVLSENATNATNSTTTPPGDLIIGVGGDAPPDLPDEPPSEEPVGNSTNGTNGTGDLVLTFGGDSSEPSSPTQTTFLTSSFSSSSDYTKFNVPPTEKYKIVNATDADITWSSPLYAYCEGSDCTIDFQVLNKNSKDIKYDLFSFGIAGTDLISNEQFYQGVTVETPQYIYNSTNATYKCKDLIEVIPSEGGDTYACYTLYENGTKEYLFNQPYDWYDDKKQEFHYQEQVIIDEFVLTSTRFVQTGDEITVPKDSAGMYRMTFNVPVNTAGKFDLQLNFDGDVVGETSVYDPFWNSTLRWSRPTYLYALNTTNMSSTVVLPINGTSPVGIGATQLWVYAIGKGKLYYNSATDYDFNDQGFGKNLMAQTTGTVVESATSLTPSTSGLIFYAPFDETAGVITQDFSGYNADGAIAGGIVSAPAKLNTGYDFEADGSDDYVTVADAVGRYDFEANTEDFSICLWIKPESWDVAEWSLIELRDADADGWQLRESTHDTGEFLFALNGVTAYNIFGLGGVGTSSWSHICVAVDRDTNIKSYINGTLKNTTNCASPAMAIAATTMYIGRRSYAASAYYDGMVDDLQIYNKALSQTEITALYELHTHTTFNSSSTIDRPNTTWQNTTYTYRRPVDLSDTLMLPLNGTTNVTLNGTQRMIYGMGDFAQFDYIYYKQQGDTLAFRLENQTDGVLEWFTTDTASHGTTSYSATNDPVFHVPLDEQSGATAEDFSGNGYDGTNMGGADVDVAGKIYDAYFFDGTNDFLNFSAHTSGLNFSAPFTISYWAKNNFTHTRAASTSNIYYLGNGIAGASKSAFVIYHGETFGTDDVFTVGIKQAGGTTVGYSRYYAYQDSSGNYKTWHHYTLTGDGTTWYLYIDGVNKPLVSMSTYSGAFNGDYGDGIDPTQTIMGRYIESGTANYEYNGTIDDFRLYPRVLLADEIRQLYTLHGKVGTNETQPLGGGADVTAPELDWNWTAINSSRPSDDVYNVCINASEAVNCSLSWDGVVWVNGTSSTDICFFNTSLAQPGNYTPIFGECTDPTGNAANTTDAWYVMDETAPVININTPATNGTYTTDFNMNVVWTSNETFADNCSWTDDHGATWNPANCNDTLTGAWVNGLNNITIWGNDTAGNEGNHTVWFYLDTIHPVIDWNWTFINDTYKPTGGLGVNNYLYNVCVNASEAVNCTMYWNTSVWINRTVSTDVCFYNLTVPDGNYSSVNVTCHDVASNEGNSSTSWANIDSVAPTVRNIFPMALGFDTAFNTSNTSIHFQGNVTEPYNWQWIDNCSLYLENATNIALNTSCALSAGAIRGWDVSCMGYLPGDNYRELNWSIRCNDNSTNEYFGHNQGQSGIRGNLSVDNIAPTLSWTWDAAIINATSNRTDLNVTTAGSEDLLACELEIAGTNYTMTRDDATNFYYEWNITTEGNYTLEVECNDTAENTGLDDGEWYRYANYTGEIEAADITFTAPATTCQDTTFAVGFDVNTNGLVGNFTSNITAPAGCNYISGDANYSNDTLGGTPVSITSNFQCHVNGLNTFTLNLTYVNNTGTAWTENVTSGTQTSVCGAGGGAGGSASGLPIDFYLTPEVIIPQNDFLAEKKADLKISVLNNGSPIYGALAFEVVKESELAAGETATSGWCSLSDTDFKNYLYKTGEKISNIGIECDLPPLDASKTQKWVERVCLTPDGDKNYKQCSLITLGNEPPAQTPTGMGFLALLDKYWAVMAFVIGASFLLFLLVKKKKKKKKEQI